MTGVRSGRWVAAAALGAAAVACLLAYSRFLGSPWCDGVTVLPAVMCDLHPTRWVSKGYPPGLFASSRKARAGEASAAQPELQPELDAAADFGENADGSVREQAGAEFAKEAVPQPQQEAGGGQQSAAEHGGGKRQAEQEQTPEDKPEADSNGGNGDRGDHELSEAGENSSEQQQQPESGPADASLAGQASDSGHQESEKEQQQDQQQGAEQPQENQPRDKGESTTGDAPAEQHQADGPSKQHSAENDSQTGEQQSERQPAEDSQSAGQAGEQEVDGGGAGGANTQPQSGGGSGGDASGDSSAASQPVEGRLPPVREWFEQQEVVWERPRGEAKGVFLALNGCNHGPDGWWDPQPACEDCLGLPEEKNIVRTAVERGYVAVALAVVQQRDRMRCWQNLTPPNWNTDMKATVKSVKTLVEREGWQGLPLYAWGGSAGGSFVARLPYYLPMKGIMVQLKSVGAAELHGDPRDPDTDEAWGYPKVVYAYNRRDPVATERARAYIDAVRAKGVDCVLLGADPAPVGPDFFERRIEEVNASLSRELYDALKQGGILDERDYISTDPRTSDKRWQALLRDQVPYANTVELRKFISPIFEELNWAFSNHQGISDCTEASFRFFETGERPDEHMLENPDWWELQKQDEPPH